MSLFQLASCLAGLPSLPGRDAKVDELCSRSEIVLLAVLSSTRIEPGGQTALIVKVECFAQEAL